MTEEKQPEAKLKSASAFWKAMAKCATKRNDKVVWNGYSEIYKIMSLYD